MDTFDEPLARIDVLQFHVQRILDVFDTFRELSEFQFNRNYVYSSRFEAMENE